MTGFWKRLSGSATKEPPGPAKKKDLVCDVCLSPTVRNDGYFLTTTQVTTSAQWWRGNIEKLVLPLPQDVATNMLTIMIEDYAKNATPWLVCERCSHMFKFDRQIARDSAVRNVAPPGSGPADPSAVRDVAFNAMLM